MSFSTIAAARQKEMKASMAVVATSTRGARCKASRLEDGAPPKDGEKSAFMNGTGGEEFVTQIGRHEMTMGLTDLPD
jgi:hypothetical protein